MVFYRYILFIVFVIAIFVVNGQYKFDFGVKFGAANYLGEIGGGEKTRRNFVLDVKFNRTNLVGGVYARYKFNGYFAISGEFNYGRISGDDVFSENVARNTRNLRFKNDIMEFSTRGEFYIYELNDVGGKGKYYFDMKMYAFSGATVFRHNPKGQIYGQSAWHDLQPLQTEGVNYSNWGIGIPAGVGLYFTYKRNHRFGWDLSWTTTFTDYLDDISTVYADPANLSALAGDLANQSDLVSTDEIILESFKPGEKRGDPTHNDTYMFTTFSYGYVIRGKSSFYKQNFGHLGGNKKIIKKVRAKF